MTQTSELIAVARGDKPADLLLKNCRIVDVLSSAIYDGNILIHGQAIAGIGTHEQARETIDLRGEYVAPALIDGHTHIESSMLHPSRYAEAVIPRGTLTVVTDLHEIANATGMAGIEFCIEWSKLLPLDMKFMAPSCVPATPLETSGAILGADDIKKLLARDDVLGLGEMMNYPGVLAGIPEVIAKIAAARGRIVDGHAPGVRGRDLDAYIAAGIMSDHECTELEEAEEKLSKGMHIMIREGSSEKNLERLLPLASGSASARCMFVIDDRSASDLDSQGDVDHIVRRAISLGLDPVRALQLATINPAQYFRLFDRGSIAPGKLAHLITFRTLDDFRVERVFYGGQLVAEDGKMLSSLPVPRGELTNTVSIDALTSASLFIPAKGEVFPVVELVEGQILTRKRMLQPGTSDGEFVSDTERDILKLAVVERHGKNGNVGKGFVKGFRLRRGALASSVAHDSHNIVAVGVSDDDILAAVRAVAQMQGGLVVCAGGAVLASLPLPVAGLLSPEPLEAVLGMQRKVEEAARELGPLPLAPFALLSFLALPVIPELRVTDVGVVDVGQFQVIA